jgi:hypothetical protein
MSREGAPHESCMSEAQYRQPHAPMIAASGRTGRGNLVTSVTSSALASRWRASSRAVSARATMHDEWTRLASQKCLCQHVPPRVHPQFLEPRKCWLAANRNCRKRTHGRLRQCRRAGRAPR